MNIKKRLERLENVSNTKGLCECIGGAITEFRTWNANDINDSTDAPVYCESCKRERRKIIVEFVDAAPLS